MDNKTIARRRVQSEKVVLAKNKNVNHNKETGGRSPLQSSSRVKQVFEKNHLDNKTNIRRPRRQSGVKQVAGKSKVNNKSFVGTRPQSAKVVEKINNISRVRRPQSANVAAERKDVCEKRLQCLLSNFMQEKRVGGGEKDEQRKESPLQISFHDKKGENKRSTTPKKNEKEKEEGMIMMIARYSDEADDADIIVTKDDHGMVVGEVVVEDPWQHDYSSRNHETSHVHDSLPEKVQEHFIPNYLGMIQTAEEEEPPQTPENKVKLNASLAGASNSYLTRSMTTTSSDSSSLLNRSISSTNGGTIFRSSYPPPMTVLDTTTHQNSSLMSSQTAMMLLDSNKIDNGSISSSRTDLMNKNVDSEFISVFEPQQMRLLALVAHNNMKESMREFVIMNMNVLKKFRLTGTKSTMTMLRSIFADDPEIIYGPECKSGPLGGDAQLVAMAASGDLGGCVFFMDPMDSHPHNADIECLVRQGNVHNILMMNNPTTAHSMMTTFRIALMLGLMEAIPSFFWDLENPCVEAYRERQAALLEHHQQRQRERQRERQQLQQQEQEE